MLHASVLRTLPSTSRSAFCVSTVAVLDDNEDVAVSISHNLRRAGFHAWPHTDERSLLTAAVAEPFDALIADWTLVDGTAQGVIATLRAIDRYRDSPIVVLTGNLCVDGKPTCPALRKAIVEHGLIFRCKPRRTADLVCDIRGVRPMPSFEMVV